MSNNLFKPIPRPSIDVEKLISNRDAANETVEVHSTGKSGALSSGHISPLWQVPASLNESAGRRMKKGNDKSYPIYNWRGGLDDVAFLRDRASHASRHLAHLLNGDNSIDDAQGNADAVTWFMAVINEALRLHPETVKAAFYSESRGEVVGGPVPPTPTPEPIQRINTLQQPPTPPLTITVPACGICRLNPKPATHYDHNGGAHNVVNEKDQSLVYRCEVHKCIYCKPLGWL